MIPDRMLRAGLVAGAILAPVLIAGCGGGNAPATTAANATRAAEGGQSVLQTDLVNDLPVPVTVSDTGHTGYWAQAPGPAFPDGPTGEVPAGKTVSIWLRPITYFCQKAGDPARIGARIGMQFAAGAGDPATLTYSLKVLTHKSNCGPNKSKRWYTHTGKWNLKTSPSTTSLRYVDPATGTEKVATITGTSVAVRITPPAG